jgi:hypothetical protein
LFNFGYAEFIACPLCDKVFWELVETANGVSDAYFFVIKSVSTLVLVKLSKIIVHFTNISLNSAG